MARLLLINPSNPLQANTNTEKVVDYVLNAIPKPMASGIIRVSEVSIDLIELWYWFDPVHGSHRIAFWGDYPAGFYYSDEASRLIDFRYFFFPATLFQIVTGRVPVEESRSRIHKTLKRFIETIDALINALPKLPEDENVARRFEDSMADAFQSESHEFDLNASGLKDDEDGDLVSPNDEEWTAILALLKYFDRVPVVSISRAAQLLGVDERTIRNRINRRELEGVPRRGTIWVTKQSIKAYIKKHYHPTSEFDMWSKYVEPRLRKKVKEG